MPPSGAGPTRLDVSGGVPTTVDTRSTFKRPDIQGLRAVAVLMVVAFHAGLPVSGGFVGVDVFFVISGYVITLLLLREGAAAHRFSLRRFYARRFKRLMPALALMVTVTLLLTILLISPVGPQQVVAETGLGAMFFVANLIIALRSGEYFEPRAETNPLLNTWSLSVEEQFYLVFPALLMFGWFIGRRVWRRAPAAIIAGLSVASFGVAQVVSAGLVLPGVMTLVGFYGPIGRAWEFGLGALLALAHHRGPRSLLPWPPAIGVIGASLVLACLWLVSPTTPWPSAWTLLPVAGTLLLLDSGRSTKTPTNRLLSSRPMALVGDWSYSIYLWHWPMVVFAGLIWPNSPVALLLAATLSLLPAVASYRFVEQPIRVMRLMDRRRYMTLIAAVYLPPVILGLLVFMGSRAAWWNPVIASYRDAAAQTMGIQRGCSYGQLPAMGIMGTCVWNADAQGPPIFLFGDSTAEHFSNAVIEAGVRTRRPVHVSTFAACPLLAWSLDLSIETRPAGLTAEQWRKQCGVWADETLQWTLEQEPGTVIIASLDTNWTDARFAVSDGFGGMSVDPDVKVTELSAALARTVEALKEHGHRAILMQSMPDFAKPGSKTQWTLGACNVVQMLTSRCEVTEPRADIEMRQGRVRAAINKVAALTGASVLDFSDAACSDSTCSTHRDGRPIYLDDHHIGANLSRELADRFAAALDWTS